MGLLYERSQTRQKVIIRYKAGSLFLAFLAALATALLALSFGLTMVYYAVWYAFLILYFWQTWRPARKLTRRMEAGAYIKSCWSGGALNKSYVIEIYRAVPGKTAQKKAQN